MGKVGIFLADGFETIEALTVADYLRRADIKVELISSENTEFVESAQNILVKPDIMLKSLDKIDDYDAFVIPGGLKGSTTLSENKKVLEILKEANEKDKKISAICAGPMVLIKAGIVDGKKITGYPGMFEDSEVYEFSEDKVVVDGNIITSRGPAITVYFALKIIEELVGSEKSKQIANDILIDIMER